MGRNTDIHGTIPEGPEALSTAGEAVESAATAPAETGEPAGFRSRLGPGLRFARHLLEMVAAMMVGMAVLGLTLWALGEPPGYANLLVEYGLMGAFMAAPMVAWMRHRDHPWRDGAEMTVVMVVPMLALALPVELGVAVPGLIEGSLMELSHAAMIAGMVALMLYRFDRYAHGPRGHHDEKGDARTARAMNAGEARR